MSPRLLTADPSPRSQSRPRSPSRWLRRRGGQRSPCSCLVAGSPGSPGSAGSAGGGGGGDEPTPSTVDFEWTVARDIEELAAGNSAPTGLWSDGSTLLLLDNASGAGDAVYAYDPASGERQAAREFRLDALNRAPRGIWAGSGIAWVSDSGRDRLFAYDLASGERLTERDVDLDRRNRDARGIWGGGGALWVLNANPHALRLRPGERRAARCVPARSGQQRPARPLVGRRHPLGLRCRRQAHLRLPPAGSGGHRSGRRSGGRSDPPRARARRGVRGARAGSATTAHAASGPTAR